MPIIYDIFISHGIPSYVAFSGISCVGDYGPIAFPVFCIVIGNIQCNIICFLLGSFDQHYANMEPCILKR